jgi:general secretion pathway protein K
VIAPERTCVTSDDRRGGFVLVTALWILAALATLVGIFTVYLWASTVNMGMHSDQVRQEAIVRAALELVAHQTSALNEKSPLIGSIGFQLGGVNATATFRGESARIDLNKAPKELLAGLFRALGAPDADAEDHADRIVAWRKRATAETNSEEALVYRGAGLSYGPRENSFPHIAELASIARMPNALVARALPFVTVYSNEPGINIDIAAPEVVGALPGMSREKLVQLLEARNERDADRTVPALLGAATRYTTGGGGAALRVTVRANYVSGKRSTTEVVIVTLNGDSEPYRVLSWTDDAEPKQ